MENNWNAKTKKGAHVKIILFCFFHHKNIVYFTFRETINRYIYIKTLTRLGEGVRCGKPEWLSGLWRASFQGGSDQKINNNVESSTILVRFSPMRFLTLSKTENCFQKRTLEDVEDIQKHVSTTWKNIFEVVKCVNKWKH